MGKPVKRIMIAIGIIIVLLIIAGGGFIIKLKSEINKMSPIETQMIVDEVYAVMDSYVNLYLIKSGDKYIMIDAGNSSGHVLNELKKLNIDPQKVAAVFLTHTDTDHVGSLSLFANAKIFISKAEEQMITGKTPRFAFFKNSLEYDYELVDDNQIIDIEGLRVLGIHTPGHTPGAMCYLINDAYLFTGDAMSLKNGEADLFNNFFNMDSETQKASLKKLSNLADAKYVFTAHYGFSNDYKNSFKRWD